MIKKYRKKFIIASFLSVFALLTAILLTINLINFAVVTNDADRVIERMIAQGGAFREEPVARDDRTGPNGQRGPDSPEIGQTTRFFTIAFDKAGSVVQEVIKMNAVSHDGAIAWARELLKRKNGWSRVYYRYRVWTREDGAVAVTVIDQSRELLPSYRVLVASCMGEAAGLVITLIVLAAVSVKVTEPIEKSDRKQKRFMRDAAFAMKDPIVAIDASCATICERMGETEETERIARETRNLIAVVQGLDTLLLAEERNARLSREDCDISSLLRGSAEYFASETEKMGKTCSLNVQEGVTYLCDPADMEKLFSILLKNGSEYAASRFEVTLQQKESRILLLFVNDAPGLDDGPLDSVFERFWRSLEVREQNIGGAGLGLSIAKEIVEAHGGRIRAEGRGGDFILKIEL